MHWATTPPGRVTRAISRAPASASRMKAITSEDSATSKVSSANGRSSAAPSRTSAPGWRSRFAAANCGDGSIAATWSSPEARGELVRQPARPAADVERAHPGRHPGGVRERDRELRHVATHEAVVVVGGRAELHGAD